MHSPNVSAQGKEAFEFQKVPSPLQRKGGAGKLVQGSRGFPRRHQPGVRMPPSATVAYVPGKDNVVADALSRWAYPASQSFNDVSWHGSEEADKEMKEIMETEKLEERKCLVAQVKPSWVRTLGPGGRFSFAKSPGQKSI